MLSSVLVILSSGGAAMPMPGSFAQVVTLVRDQSMGLIRVWPLPFGASAMSCNK